MKNVYSGVYSLSSTVTREKPELVWPSVLLGIFIVLPDVLPVSAETILYISFLFFPATIWLFSKYRLPADLPRFTGPLLLIMLVGLLNFTGHKTYDIAKDIWYLLNPALAITVGFVLMQNLKDLKKLFRVFVIAATLIALLHLLRIAMHPEMLLNSAIDIRKEAGGGFFEPVLSIALFFAARKMKMQIFGSQVWISYLTFSLCMLSVILSFSRTLEVALILISLSVFGWINFQSRIKVMIVVAVVAAIFGLGMSLPPAHENTAHPGVID